MWKDSVVVLLASGTVGSRPSTEFSENVFFCVLVMCYYTGFTLNPIYIYIFLMVFSGNWNFMSRRKRKSLLPSSNKHLGFGSL